MRRGTAIYLLLFLGVVAGLVGSIRHTALPKDEGKRVITFIAWGAAEEIGELQAILDDINADEDRFVIRLTPVPGDYFTKLATLMAANKAPDLFYLGVEDVPVLAEKGVLMDLTAMIEADDDPVTNLEDYYAPMLEPFTREDRIYGLPWIAQPVIAYCNARLFREAGVPLPDGSWDWAAFARVGEQLTRDTSGDGRPDVWGFILQPGWPPHHMWIWQNDARLVRSDGRLNLDDPRVVEALDEYAGYIHADGIAPPLSVVDETGFSEMFRAGRVAIFMGGAADQFEPDPAAIDGTESGEPPLLEAVAAEVPAGPSGVRATFAWTAGLHISADADDPQLVFEAWKRVLAAMHRWKIPAPRRSLAGTIEQVKPRKAPSADVIRRSMQYMRPPTIIERQAEFGTLFHEDVLTPLLVDGVPAETAIERAKPVLEPWR